MEIAGLQPGPIQHETLSDTLVRRIIAIHDFVNDVLPAPLEKRIDDFRRDLNPEREIQVWERIVGAYRELTSDDDLDLASKREALSALIELTMLEPAEQLRQCREFPEPDSTGGTGPNL